MVSLFNPAAYLTVFAVDYDNRVARLNNEVTFSEEYWLQLLLEDFCDLSTARRPRRIPGVRPSAFQRELDRQCDRLLPKFAPEATVSKNDRWPIVRSIAHRLMTDLDTPFSKRCASLLSDGSERALKELVGFKLDPSSYTCSDQFYRDYQASTFLKKYESLPIETDRSLNTRKSWVEAEVRCQETNIRLTDKLNTPLRLLLNSVRERVLDILGPSPSMAQLAEGLKYGPGATTTLSGTRSCVFAKVEADLHVSRTAYPILQRMKHLRPELFPGPLVLTDVESKYLEVPKTALVNRPIGLCVHADVMVQLSIGSLIRGRLKLAGINLNHQAARNAVMAKQGSLDGTFATIDLKAASDTISSVLVKHLLPKGWYNLMAALRARNIELDGELHLLHKFSSMGNGYTFELESLLFGAIAQVACAQTDFQNIGVFGDDLIVPSEHAQRLIDMLDMLGFETNKDKTFISGPFRESCGNDFFNGHPVRPYYLKKEVKHVTQFISMANGLRRVAHRFGLFAYSDESLRGAWNMCLYYVPVQYLVVGPSSLGDSVIHACKGEVADAEEPVQLDYCWRVGRRALKLSQRGINYYAYRASTILTGYFLYAHQHGNAGRHNYDDDIGMIVSKFQVFDHHAQDILAGWIKPPATAQRTMRSNEQCRPVLHHKKTPGFWVDCPSDTSPWL